MYTQAEYEAKRQARYERLQAAASKAAADSESLLDQAHRMAEVIPFGQPILVGHHSERRDRNYRARIENKYRKGYELYKRAQDLQSRAESVENNTAIFSDDPSAPDKLAAKVQELEELQATYKAINKAHTAYLKNPASLTTCGLSEKYQTLIRTWTPAYGYEKHPIQPYQLSNLSANIRTAKQRLEQVQKRQAMETTTETINGVSIECNPSENRIRVQFPARLSPEHYNTMKHNGFRWSPTLKAFSAYCNRHSLAAARAVAQQLPTRKD